LADPIQPVAAAWPGFHRWLLVAVADRQRYVLCGWRQVELGAATLRWSSSKPHARKSA